MLISEGSFRVCKNHKVIMLILLTLLKKTCYAVNSIEKKSTTLKNFTWARAQVCHVHPTPMILTYYVSNFKKLKSKLLES